MPKIEVKGKTITYDELQNIINAVPKKKLTETEKFLKGDHWQGGDGWVGYTPDATANPDGAAKTLLQIQKAFKPQNVCLTMVKHVQGAILGKQPDWKIVARDENGAAIKPDIDPEKEKARTKSKSETFFETIDTKVTKWFTDKEVHEHLKRFIFNKASYGKAAIRIYIPRGFLSDDGTITERTFEEVLSKIYIDTPHFLNVNDAPDVDYGSKFAVVATDQDDKTVFEVCYTDENRQTVLRQAHEEGTGTDSDVSIDLSGNLLTYIAGAFESALISETVKQLQKGLNHAKTGENLALANINFPDTTFIGADLPTETKTIAGKTQEVAKPLLFGPGRWRNLIGQKIVDAMGGESMVTPDVKFRDGADPDKFHKVAENDALAMYQEGGMGWLKVQESPYPSGESRVEAMSAYLILLIDSKTLCDAVGVWLLSTVVRFAFHFTGDKKKNDDFDVIYSSKITLGRMSVEDKKLMLEEVKARVRSRRNYQIAAEVTDDPFAEDNAITLEVKTAPEPMPDNTGNPKPTPTPAT